MPHVIFKPNLDTCRAERDAAAGGSPSSQAPRQSPFTRHQRSRSHIPQGAGSRPPPLDLSKLRMSMTSAGGAGGDPASTRRVGVRLSTARQTPRIRTLLTPKLRPTRTPRLPNSNGRGGNSTLPHCMASTPLLDQWAAAAGRRAEWLEDADTDADEQGWVQGKAARCF